MKKGTLKEQFIKYFGEFKKHNSCQACTEEKECIKIFKSTLLANKDMFLKIEVNNSFVPLNMNWVFSDMRFKKKYDYLKNIDAYKKVERICKEIEILNLEKQLIDDVKDLPISKKSIIKF